MTSKPDRNSRVAKLMRAVEANKKEILSIQDACDHPDTFRDTYSWRPGCMDVAEFCTKCFKLIRVITPENAKVLSGTVVNVNVNTWTGEAQTMPAFRVKVQGRGNFWGDFDAKDAQTAAEMGAAWHDEYNLCHGKLRELEGFEDGKWVLVRGHGKFFVKLTYTALETTQ